MSAPKRGKKKEQEFISISEFKQWLSGVEDMQPDDWVPDSIQWAKIRAKIESLADEEWVAPTPAAAPMPANPYAPVPFVPAYNPPNYSSLADMNHQPQSRPRQQTMDDGIMIPSKTAEDIQMDSAMMGMGNVPNNFV